MAPPFCSRPNTWAARRARALLPLAFAAGLALTVGAPGRAGAAGPATIAVDMDPAAPGIQSSLPLPLATPDFTIDIVVQNANAFGAFEFWIHYDNIALAYEGWTEGSFLGSTGRPTQCFQIVNETSLRIGCATSGPPPPDGPSGDGVLGSLRFRPRFASGEVCFPFLLVETADADGTPWPTNDQGGCVTILPPTPTPTATPTDTPTSTATPLPTETPRPSQTPARTATVATTRTVGPQHTATARTATAAPQQTASSTAEPSSSPSPRATSEPPTVAAEPTGEDSECAGACTGGVLGAPPVVPDTPGSAASPVSGTSANALPGTGDGHARATSNLALVTAFIGMVLLVVAIRVTFLSDDED